MTNKHHHHHHHEKKGALSSEFKLFIAITGIYTCYIAYGIYQEALYHYKSSEGKKFTATFFFLLVQCLANVILAGALMLFFGGSKNHPPTLSYITCGFSYIGAMLFSNEALKYVSYPTQALGN